MAMNRKLIALSQRRSMLVARATDQRIRLSEIRENLEEPLAWLKTGFLVARSIRAHPQIAAVSVMTAFLTFGRKLPRIRIWLGRVIAMYQLSRFLRARYLSR